MNAISVLFDPNIPIEDIAEALARAGIIIDPTTYQRDVYVARKADQTPALIRKQAG
jgi:hypothetical protein